MKDLKQVASDLFEQINPQNGYIDFAVKFAQHLVDKGVLVEKVYLDFCDSERSRLAGELAEIYISKEKDINVPQSKVITDEEIEARVKEAYPENDKVTQRLCYKFGAKWYRDQLNKQ